MAERAKVGVLISGRGSNMIALAEAAERSTCPYEIAIVCANDPDASGLTRARMMGIATWGASHKDMERAAFDALIDARLREARVEYVALAGYMRRLSPEFVTRWEGRMINIHPSLLPKYKGTDVYRRALEAGDAVAGCSVHLVTAEVDGGPVLAQAEVPILPGDTPEALAGRILSEEHKLYPRVLAEFVTR